MGAIGSRQKEGTFHILVKTGDKKGASTDGNVSSFRPHKDSKQSSMNNPQFNIYVKFSFKFS